MALRVWQGMADPSFLRVTKDICHADAGGIYHLIEWWPR